MPNVVPPLAFFCINAVARAPDQLRPRRIPAIPALLDAFPRKPDPRLWAALAQLIDPLPSDLHDYDLPLSHPDLPLLQRIPHTPDFALVTLVSLPHCLRVRDDDVANLRTLHCLVALDLRGCSISSYALTALTRGLVSNNRTRTGPWGLRLLSLHGCPNIDNDVLSVLHKFPLLSAIDLRFTRCTPSAVNARLSALAFGPSSNNSLFYPASLSLALCTLEKIAHAISLYSCPPRSVFRIHVDKLSHPVSHSNKVVPADNSRTPQTTIRTITSAEDVIVFIPPLRSSAKNVLPEPSGSTNAVSTSPLIDRSTPAELVSNVSSFYDNTPVNRNSRVLPLSAQAVQSSKGGKSDPLAIARAPPPWKMLDTHDFRALPKPDMVARPQNTFLKVDPARLRKRGSDSVADMVNQLARKRPKIESEFALVKARATATVKARNPFASIHSAFAESSKKPSAQVKEPSQETRPGNQLRTCRSLPSKPGETIKPLRPILSIKPPIIPKEWLTPLPPAQRSRRKLKQTRLSFSREEKEDEDVDLDFD